MSVYEITDGAGIVRYIGKGPESRAREHFQNARALRQGRAVQCVPADRRMAEALARGETFMHRMVATDLTPAEAYALEVSLIARHGREVTGDGTLWNIMPGGETFGGYQSMPYEHRCETSRKAHATMKARGGWKNGYAALPFAKRSETSRKAHATMKARRAAGQ
jgi:hypothetical protein